MYGEVDAFPRPRRRRYCCPARSAMPTRRLQRLRARIAAEEAAHVERHRRRRLAGQHLLEMPPREPVLAPCGRRRGRAPGGRGPAPGGRPAWRASTAIASSSRASRRASGTPSSCDAPIAASPSRNRALSGEAGSRASGRRMASASSNRPAPTNARASFTLAGGAGGSAPAPQAGWARQAAIASARRRADHRLHRSRRAVGRTEKEGGRACHPLPEFAPGGPDPRGREPGRPGPVYSSARLPRAERAGDRCPAREVGVELADHAVPG